MDGLNLRDSQYRPGDWYLSVEHVELSRLLVRRLKSLLHLEFGDVRDS